MFLTTSDCCDTCVKVILITRLDFLSKRKRNWDVVEPRELSLEVMAALRDAWPEVSTYVVLVTGTQYNNYASDLLAAGFYPFKLSDFSIAETMIRLKARLQDLGVKFKPVRSLRTVSPLNLEKFTKGLRVFSSEDYKKAGIEPDKKKSFQELVEVRQKDKDAWW